MYYGQHSQEQKPELHLMSASLHVPHTMFHHDGSRDLQAQSICIAFNSDIKGMTGWLQRHRANEEQNRLAAARPHRPRQGPLIS